MIVLFAIELGIFWIAVLVGIWKLAKSSRSADSASELTSLSSAESSSMYEFIGLGPEGIRLNGFAAPTNAKLFSCLRMLDSTCAFSILLSLALRF